MVRETRGVFEGVWYFKIKVSKLKETCHTRRGMGGSWRKGGLQVLMGYDGINFGFRDMDGSKVHNKTEREV